jgi:hypothetical protein
LLSVLGVAAVYYLWFSQAYVLLALALLLSLAAVGVLGGVGSGVWFVIGSALPAITLSVVRKRGRDVACAVAAATAFPVIGMVVKFGWLTGLLQFLGQSLKETSAWQQPLFLYPPGKQALVVDMFNRFAERLIFFVPGMIILTLALIFLGGALLGNHLVRGSGRFAAEITEFSLWKVPEWVMIPLGIAAILVLTNQRILAIIGWNALLFLYAIYSLVGLSFLEFQMRRRRFPGPVKAIIYLFLFVTQLVAAVVLPLVALFDSKFDFRRTRAKRVG